MKKLLKWITSIFILITLLSGCGGSSSSSIPSITLKTIQISVADSSIAPLGINRQFTAVGVYSDGTTVNLTNSVKWSSSNVSAGTIDSAGLFTPIGIGSSSINATFESVTSNTITMTTINEILESISISAADQSPTTALGVPEIFIATGHYSNGSNVNITSAVSWVSESAGIATISNNPGSNGVATPVKVGTSAITAAIGDIISSPVTFTVTSATLTGIQISAPSYSLPLGINSQFTAFATFSDGSSTNITNQANWISSNPSIATFTVNGLLHPLSVGNTNVSASFGGKTSETVPIAVTSASLSSITVSLQYQSTGIGVVQRAVANGTFSDNSTMNLTNQVNWYESNGNPSVTVDANGFVTSISPGSESVIAALNGISGSSSVTVTDATVKGLVLVPSSESTPLGVLQYVRVVGTYSDDTTYDLTNSAQLLSSDTSIATIATGSTLTAGVITPVTLGLTTITATMNGAAPSAFSFTVDSKLITSIAITPNAVSVPKGTSTNLTAMAIYSDGSTGDVTNSVTWSSNDAFVATVDNNGEVTANDSSGTVDITASLNGVTSANPAIVTATDAILTSISIEPVLVSVPKGLSQEYTAIGMYSDGSLANITNSVAWNSTDPSVAIIISTGYYTIASVIAGSGTTYITAYKGGITSNRATLTATPAIPEKLDVSPSYLNTVILNVLDTQQFTATEVLSDGTQNNVTNQATWVSTNPATATVSATGLVTAISVNASPVGIYATYNSLQSLSTSVLVTP